MTFICGSVKDGKTWRRPPSPRSLFILVTVILLVVRCVSTAGIQLPDCDVTYLSKPETDTSLPVFPLSCSLPVFMSSSSPSHWRWSRLAADSHVSLSSNISSALTHTTYQVGVECGTQGEYQALYLDSNDHCLYSCHFLLEIMETDLQQILSALETFSNQTSLPAPVTPDAGTTNLSLAAHTTNIPLGPCAPVYHLPSGCSLAVNSTWFKDGAPLQFDTTLYSGDFSEESLTIVNLTDRTAGYYTCLTHLPYNLGSYLTVNVNIATATTSVPPPATPSPSVGPPPIADSGLFLGLEAWEVWLVGANALAVLTLLLCVLTAVLCVCQRKPAISHDDDNKDHVSLKELVKIEEESECSTGTAEIPFNSIVFQELLHKGTFKTVHRALVNHPPGGMLGQEVALKRLKDSSSELGREELNSEAVILRSILDKAGTHPHFASLLGVTTSPGSPLCLLLEYSPHGTLDRFLWSLKKGPVPEWYLRHSREVPRDLSYHRHVACDLMKISQQVTDGMCFLAGHGFVHRDLSTRNVLVGPQLQAKIANPGMFHDGNYYLVTEREHFLADMAPECLWEKRYSLFSDVWSFGIMLYKVVTLETNPYPGVPPKELYNHIVVHKQRPRLLSSFSNELYFLLQGCWQVTPTDRPTFPLISSELKTLSSSPNRHIILKTSKDELTPGYVSENGQVFLHFVPPYFFQSRTYPPSNPVSPADDTIYSRERADSLLYLVSSEVESTFTSRETEYDEAGGQSTWDIETEREDGGLPVEGKCSEVNRFYSEVNIGSSSQESHDDNL